LRRLRTTAPHRCQYLYFGTSILFLHKILTPARSCGSSQCQYFYFCSSVYQSVYFCTCAT
jgi:hypothetical protein